MDVTYHSYAAPRTRLRRRADRAPGVEHAGCACSTPGCGRCRRRARASCISPGSSWPAAICGRAGADGRAVHGGSVRAARQPDVPDRGPGAAALGRPRRVPRPYRPAGQAARQPHRAGRDRVRARRAPRGRPGGGDGPRERPGRVCRARRGTHGRRPPRLRRRPARTTRCRGGDGARGLCRAGRAAAHAERKAGPCRAARAAGRPRGGRWRALRRRRTPVEDVLCELFARGARRRDGARGLDDDFFALGGHSLLATLVWSARIRVGAGGAEVGPARRCSRRRPSPDWPRAIDRGAITPARPALVPRPNKARPERVPLSFAQQRMWLLDQLDPDRQCLHYHRRRVELHGPLQLDARAAQLRVCAGIAGATRSCARPLPWPWTAVPVQLHRRAVSRCR